jgi:hypothetical protein
MFNWDLSGGWIWMDFEPYFQWILQKCSYPYIASYNCNGLADKKRQSVFTWLKEKECNICCLQETHSTILDGDLWKKD